MRTTVNDLIIRTCEKHSLTRNQLLGVNRQYAYSHPRQELMFAVFTECPHISYPDMGRRIGRDHTSCLWGVKRHCERVGLSYQDAKDMRAGKVVKHTFADMCRDYQEALEAARV